MSQRTRSAVFGWTLCLVAAVIAGGAWQLGAFESPGEDAMRTAAEKLQKAGNFREAYNNYRKLIVEPRTTARLVPKDLEQAIVCLSHLGEIDEIDGLVTAAVEAHPKNWRLLKQAALAYLNTEHYGYVVAGKFNRGHRRGGGEFVSSIDRDRILALQLLDQARPLVVDEPAKAEVGDFYQQFAETVFYGLEAWELQVLSDWKQLPDFEPGNYRLEIKLTDKGSSKTLTESIKFVVGS